MSKGDSQAGSCEVGIARNSQPRQIMGTHNYLKITDYQGNAVCSSGQSRKVPLNRTKVCLATIAIAVSGIVSGSADSIPTTILDPNLQVTTFIGTDLVQPIGIVFLGPGDALV